MLTCVHYKNPAQQVGLIKVRHHHYLLKKHYLNCFRHSICEVLLKVYLTTNTKTLCFKKNMIIHKKFPWNAKKKFEKNIKIFFFIISISYLDI